jgi:single-stranded-DNA-specific exonuclease
MRFRWDPLPPRPLESRVIQQALGVREITAACLLARGLGDPGEASAFLAPRLKDLADPFRLPNMQGAVQRLLDARVRGEHVTLFGDGAPGLVADERRPALRTERPDPCDGLRQRGMPGKSS